MKYKLALLILLSLFSVKLLGQSPPPYLPTNGLGGWWPFNGNANDESGNGNHGVALGASLTNDRAGSSQQAYLFNGFTNYISINSSSPSMLPANEITLSVWFQINGSNYISNNQLGPLIRSRFYGYIIWYDSVSTSIQVITHHNNAGTIIASDTRTQPGINDGAWHHLVSTFDGLVCKLFIDGVLIDSDSISGNLYYIPDGIVAFGKDGNNASTLTAHYSGKLDDIGIWNRALTQQEITAVYTGQAACIKPEPVSLGTSASTRLCPNESVSIEIVSPADSANYTYQWTRNGTNMPGATTRSITVNDAAKYKVFVRSGPGTNCQRVSGLVETTAATPPAVTASTPNGNTLCLGDSVLMTATGATSGYSYRWKRYGVVIPGATSSTYYATQTGNYRCEIYNTGGCITQSNLISINNGTSCRLMGELDSDVSVYPNPAHDNLTVSFRDIGNENPVSISLRTLQGQNIETRPVSSKEYLTFTVGKLAPGIYVVSILLDSGDSVERSIVVQ